MKKILLSLGTVTSIIIPITSVISCSNSDSDSIDITKGDGKEIVDVLENNWGFHALSGDITDIKTNIDFDKVDPNKMDNKFIKIIGSYGTAEMDFSNDKVKPFSLLYKAKDEKKMKEYNLGESNYDYLKTGAKIVMESLGYI